MSIDPPTFASRDDFNLELAGGDIKGRQRQNEPEPREGTERTNLRLLDIPTVGLVIKEISLTIKAQSVLLKGLQSTLPGSAVYTVDGR